MSACSEDILYRDLSIAQRISDRISEKTGDGHLSKSTMIANVEDMLTYLKRYREEYISKPQHVIKDLNINTFNLLPCFDALEKMKNQWHVELSVAEKKELYPKDAIFECLVTNIITGGIFVLMDTFEEAFIPTRNLSPFELDDFEIMGIVSARVVKYNEKHNRFELTLIEKVD